MLSYCEIMDPDIVDELVAASRTKHLKFRGEGVLRGGLVRSIKVVLSPRTGSLSKRLGTVRDLFDSNKISIRLPRSNGLPRDFVRLEPWETEYLFAAARQATLGVVETGRFRGGSTLVMASAAPNIPLWSIDISPQDDQALQHLMSRMKVGSCVKLIIADSTTDVQGVGEFDLLWIDGDHSLAGCLGDITRWWPRLAPGGSMILHDCYLGSEVMDAVAVFLKERRDYLIVAGVVNGRTHCRSATGSLCHIRKLN